MANTSVFVLTNDFPDDGAFGILRGKYSESFRTAKRLGYDGVELVVGDPDRVDRDEVKAALAETGLALPVLNSGGIQYVVKAALVHSSSQTSALGLEKLCRNLDLCHEFGALQQVGVARGFIEPGRRMRWFKDALVDALKSAADYANSIGVQIAFEYTNRHEINTINTANECQDIVERVAASNVGMVLDTGHSYLEDPDICQAILQCGSLLRHVHLHDSNGGAAIIGGGETDFDQVVAAFGKIGYSGWFSDGLQTRSYADTEIHQSTAQLRELYARYLPGHAGVR